MYLDNLLVFLLSPTAMDYLVDTCCQIMSLLQIDRILKCCRMLTILSDISGETCLLCHFVFVCFMVCVWAFCQKVYSTRRMKAGAVINVFHPNLTAASVSSRNRVYICYFLCICLFYTVCVLSCKKRKDLFFIKACCTPFTITAVVFCFCAQCEMTEMHVFPPLSFSVSIQNWLFVSHHTEIRIKRQKGFIVLVVLRSFQDLKVIQVSRENIKNINL